ncbi:ubiquitin carboxyl-terminal hydrolase 21-like [Macrosteles quadrilineatus]|uniref:ubiquitin carboxyl-terminal hydrolase 21-like n=1 Tax=Macrosteles quadrilineatus TaxID=74068 RepID=UPI0023E258C5|nr:ubiquitin carboxyl-terminal hydrolase 21-like [Macrosteles quadrilineatus]
MIKSLHYITAVQRRYVSNCTLVLSNCGTVTALEEKFAKKNPYINMDEQQDTAEFLASFLNILNNEEMCEECFRLLFKDQEIRERVCPQCEHVGATQMTKITEIPKILIVQLNRFGLVGETCQKLTNRVEFPIRDLSRNNFTDSYCELRLETMHTICYARFPLKRHGDAAEISV